MLGRTSEELDSVTEKRPLINKPKKSIFEQIIEMCSSRLHSLGKQIMLFSRMAKNLVAAATANKEQTQGNQPESDYQTKHAPKIRNFFSTSARIHRHLPDMPQVLDRPIEPLHKNEILYPNHPVNGQLNKCTLKIEEPAALYTHPSAWYASKMLSERQKRIEQWRTKYSPTSSSSKPVAKPSK